MHLLKATMAALLLTHLSHASSLHHDLSDLLPFDAEKCAQWCHGIEQETGLRYDPCAPAVATFQKDGKELVYILAAHTADDPENPTCPMFGCITSVVTSLQPHLMILEGFDTSEEMHKSVCILTKNPAPHKVLQEPMYGAFLAQKYGIPFVGGEPSDHIILEALKEKGYTPDDMAFFYFLQQLPQVHRESPLTQENIQDCFEGLAKGWTSIFGKENTYEGFQAWCLDKLGRILVLEDILCATSTLTHPFLARMHKDAMWARDRTTLTRLLDAVESHQKVMIIYGSSHFYTQHKVLEKYLGKPTFAL
ncbi:MAG: hypothetical protein C0514_05905 [Candidatus Puniceispirillum sp.]|nr:hypothetical protein [Candidatus Puniceispirillum sp.]